MKKQMICISCPMGCRLEVDIENETIVSIAGNSCPRGIAYAKDECLDPKRMVTTIVRVQGRELPLPVKTARPIQKAYIMESVRAVQALVLQPPVKIGDVIVKNVCNTGVDIVAAANAE